MELTFTTFLIVCPMIFLASFVDAVAGGGGLISLPAYFLAGVPIHNAIATNKLSSATGTCISTWRFCKNKFADIRLAVPSVVTALAGSALGANIALVTSDRILKLTLLAVLPVAAFYVFRNKDMEEQAKKPVSNKAKYAIVITASFIVGAYDGFYGPGTGTFLILIYTGMAHMDVRTAAGNTKLVNLSSNIAALVTFMIHGKIIFPLGLAASVFSIAGHYLGSGMVMKNGTRVVRPIILAVLGLLFVKVVTGI
jgi:uncharacterized membrane protein YfcA